jgi:hypothetical protein
VSDPLSDFLKDPLLPALYAIGTIRVGIGAIAAADQSNGLAAQVRDDEQQRDAAAAAAAAARDRYRDQLFRVIEPTVSAMLALRAEIQTSHRVGHPAEALLRSDVISRLSFVSSVATRLDRRVALACLQALNDALSTGRANVTGHVLGILVLLLPELIEEPRDIDGLVKAAKEATPAAEKLFGGSASPSTSAAPTP